MILALNTATATTRLQLYNESGKALQEDIWESGRQLSAQLLDHIEALLEAQKATWSDLTGVVVFQGPGSFTGLRIGITVANTLAFASAIPIVGETGDSWARSGVKRVKTESDRQVTPWYGAPANISKPKPTA